MNKAKKIAAPDDTQFKLFGAMPDGANGRLLKTAVNSGRRFITGDASAIYLGPPGWKTISSRQVR